MYDDLRVPAILFEPSAGRLDTAWYSMPPWAGLYKGAWWPGGCYQRCRDVVCRCTAYTCTAYILAVPRHDMRGVDVVRQGRDTLLYLLAEQRLPYEEREHGLIWTVSAPKAADGKWFAVATLRGHVGEGRSWKVRVPGFWPAEAVAAFTLGAVCQSIGLGTMRVCETSISPAGVLHWRAHEPRGSLEVGTGDGTATTFAELVDFSGGKVIREEDGDIMVETLEGMLRASPGDYVLRGTRGEVWPCRWDIFEETYVEAAPAPPTGVAARPTKMRHAFLLRLGEEAWREVTETEYRQTRVAHGFGDSTSPFGTPTRDGYVSGRAEDVFDDLPPEKEQALDWFVWDMSGAPWARVERRYRRARAAIVNRRGWEVWSPEGPVLVIAAGPEIGIRGQCLADVALAVHGHLGWVHVVWDFNIPPDKRVTLASATPETLGAALAEVRAGFDVEREPG